MQTGTKRKVSKHKVPNKNWLSVSGFVGGAGGGVVQLKVPVRFRILLLGTSITIRTLKTVR